MDYQLSGRDCEHRLMRSAQRRWNEYGSFGFPWEVRANQAFLDLLATAYTFGENRSIRPLTKGESFKLDTDCGVITFKIVDEPIDGGFAPY